MSREDFKYTISFSVSPNDCYFDAKGMHHKSGLDDKFFDILRLFTDTLLRDGYFTCCGDTEIAVFQFLFNEINGDFAEYVHKLQLENERLRNVSLSNFSSKYGFRKNKLVKHLGRKPKLTTDQVNIIKSSNKSYRALSKEYDCSLGLIAKIKKESIM